MNIEYSPALAVQQTKPVAISIPDRKGRGVYLSNLPSYSEATSSEGRSLIGYTPQLKELIEDSMPLFWHMLERNNLNQELPIFLFYINPKETIRANAEKLICFYERLEGTDCICLPVSNCHSVLLNTYETALSSLEYMDLSSVTLVYIGDDSNQRVMSRIAKEAGMPFYFHALY